MTALFEYLHGVQLIWVDNLQYQVKQGWVWLDPILTLVRDYFFETTVVVTVILLYSIIFSAISLYGQKTTPKKIIYTDEFKNLVKGVDLHLGDEPKKAAAKKVTKKKGS
ncbi:MAG: hypothetical protein ACR2IC_00040 [Candidatus Methylopumilus sp.]